MLQISRLKCWLASVFFFGIVISVHAAAPAADSSACSMAVRMGQKFGEAFQISAWDQRLVILVDLPNEHVPIDPEWKERLVYAQDWARQIKALYAHLDVQVVLYENVGSPNAVLPSTAWVHDYAFPIPESTQFMRGRFAVPLEPILAQADIVIGLNKFSTTSPLKHFVQDGKGKFRGATMPGFNKKMFKALSVNTTEVHRRCQILKNLLDRTGLIKMKFQVGEQAYDLQLDIRGKKAIIGSGIITEPETVTNLPGGESYIVPNEGWKTGQPSRTEGFWPFQDGDEVVVYRVEDNRAVAVITEGPQSKKAADLLKREPAYGNIAEFGLGVLRDLGVEPIGSILNDEKLGPHTGRAQSDHFKSDDGRTGDVGVADFVADYKGKGHHSDLIYVLGVQPKILLVSVELDFEDGSEPFLLVKDGNYVPGLFDMAVAR